MVQSNNRRIIRRACAWMVILMGAGALSLLAGPSSAWESGAGFRSLKIFPPEGKSEPGFKRVPTSVSGIQFTNLLEGDLFLTNAVLHNGSGVAVGDVTGDGWPEIYFCALQGPNRLYRNLQNWRFEEMDIGEAACPGQFSTAAVFADVDGDADLDLLVNGVAAGTRLFLNDGQGHWSERKGSGLARAASATSMALADMDGDGDLDLYCAHYIDFIALADPTTRLGMGRREGQWVVTKVNEESTRLPRWKDRFETLPDGSVRELPEVDGLYRNNGQGEFTPIQAEPGVFRNEHGVSIPPFRDWGLAVMFRDLNSDGAPDLYVCNDNASPDRIWMNSGRGTFRLQEAGKIRHTSRSSMGIDFGDINRDGHDDFVVVDMLAREHQRRLTQLVKDHSEQSERERPEAQPRYNRNMLFLGRADGAYAEAALQAALAASDWSWCPIFIDVDLDGYEDLLISTGFSFDVMDQDSHDQIRGQRNRSRDQLKRARQLHPAWPTRFAAFKNNHDGTFSPQDEKWGFAQPGIAYGMALGDLDNDGDLDLVVNHLNDAAGIYRNESTAGRIQIRLRGIPPNSEGTGARIQLINGDLTQTQEILCGGRYLSGDQAIRTFAALDPDRLGRLEIQWRNGDRTVLPTVLPNRIYEVHQSDSVRQAHAKPPARSEPFFRDASALLNHAHAENSFHDWEAQPLLPNRLSRLGPGVSWFDLNGDGWEDLSIGTGRGGKMVILTNDHGAGFRKVEGLPLAVADQTALLGWTDGNGERRLLAAMSNYESDPHQPSEIEVYSLKSPAQAERWPVGPDCIGPLAAADVDGDGDLDLFVGGRFRSGQYPKPVSSSIWLNEKGKLRPSRSLSQAFDSIGLVSGAVFSDLDNDGDPDLALALDWGAVRVFENKNGSFYDATERRKLDGWTGRWMSIASGDFDGDGRMDLVAGNWGRNSDYELHQPARFRLFYGNWRGDDRVEIIEAWQSGKDWLPIRNLHWMAAGWPELVIQYPSHSAYSKARVPDLLGDMNSRSQAMEARDLESAVFLNRGEYFDRRKLPAEAQLTPVFSLNVGDFDGDGIEDLFAGQNFFGSGSEITREDSGTGLWLKGSGNGEFKAIDPSLSGIRVEGEQRGGALADLNRDGRVDLAVSQNNGLTKLFINQGAKVGLRVVVKGPPANPDGIGTQMRLIYAEGKAGPCRTVSAGSGYWSQDGATQVLGHSDFPAAVWFRFPDGNTRTVSLSSHPKEIEVTWHDRK